jgi:predicted SAM-dependent methyltransferase
MFGTRSNLENQIKELKRLLKPNGTLIIAVPNFKSFDAKYYGKFWPLMYPFILAFLKTAIKCFSKT